MSHTARLVNFDDERAIVIERFDRHRRTAQAEGTSIARGHQEDFAQATGTHPTVKYQNEGGPASPRSHSSSSDRFGQRGPMHAQGFFDATIFNWVALGTDAHAKNYALLWPTARTGWPRLAPLYDSAQHWRTPRSPIAKQSSRLSFDGRYRTSRSSLGISCARQVSSTASWGKEPLRTGCTRALGRTSTGFRGTQPRRRGGLPERGGTTVRRNADRSSPRAHRRSAAAARPTVKARSTSLASHDLREGPSVARSSSTPASLA